LTTGTTDAAANSATEPSSGWRTTRTSEYPETTREVSAIDSPLAMDEKVKPVVVVTSPPSRRKADSKLSRVRVLGSKNRLPRMAPSSTVHTARRSAIGRTRSARSNSFCNEVRSNC